MERKVTVIPPTLHLQTHQPTTQAVRRRVAGYARVSTDSEEQQTSYAAQVEYYTSYIQERSDWEFVKVYTDEGISATNTKHRDGFNQMISDALDGKIDLIVTKSVSRFARNTVDSLTTVRKLKEKGIEVYFQKENIYTLDSKGELLITIMSSLAQEESRSISENVTWGQRKRMADGKVSLPYGRFLGYRKGENGLPEIVPEEAEIVRFIYRNFMHGDTPHHIAEKLTLKGISTPGGKRIWSTSTIESILTNEKYKGAALLQKKFTVDFLTKKTKINEGEVPQYYIEDSHPAIIPPKEFELVQAEYLRRKQFGRKYNSKSIFTARLICECCGGFYGSKVWHSTSKYHRVIWQCNHKFQNGDKCTTPHLYEDQIKEKFITAINQVLGNKEEIIENCMLLCDCITDVDDTAIEKLIQEMNMVSDLIRNLIKQQSTTKMKPEVYQAEQKKLDERYKSLKSRYDALVLQKDVAEGKKKFIRQYAEMLQQHDVITEFSDELWLKSIENITVCTDETMIFRFKDGTEIRE